MNDLVRLSLNQNNFILWFLSNVLKFLYSKKGIPKLFLVYNNISIYFYIFYSIYIFQHKCP